MRIHKDRWTPFLKEFYLGYYFKSDTGQLIHDSILRFKEGYSTEVDQWTKVVLKKIDDNPDFPQIDYVIRVLGSKELMNNDNKPTQKLARRIAEHLDAEFVPDIFSKTRTTEKQSMLGTVPKKKKEIEDVFVINESYDFDGKSVLIVDDVRTAGVTSQELARIINIHHTPSAMYLLTILKTVPKDEFSKLVNDELAQYYRQA